MKSEPKQSSAASADKAMQGAETHARQPREPDRGVKAGVWTERMLSALASGVKGGKWFSLMDKVYAPKTLALASCGCARGATTKVRANKGAAGVDGQSIERFVAKAGLYLSELSAVLREGKYQPQAVRRVDIPKGANPFCASRKGGRTRPLGIPPVKDRIMPRMWNMTFSRQSVSSSSRSSRAGSAKEATASVVVLKARLRHDDEGAMMRRADARGA